ncbi:MAG: DUF4350 domain-containing protein [Sulfolobales archaeon]|nr:DUF4350 domain-containing protein [Sulfolobales archaeon]MCX8209313.1 DUF4350 domain-containing protein [Sulfolobales archaeon]MDW8010723.1 DUF4350 domain-containing protein [Sulfolobales archaeon]
MTPSRELLAALAALWIVLLSAHQIPLVQFIAGDPPSVLNRADGGLSELVSTLTVYRRVKIARSFDEIWQYNPGGTVLILSGLDSPPRKRDVSLILEWVRRGGKVVVLDEYTTPTLLLEEIGIGLGSLASDVAVGECRLGSTRHPVLFNVYRGVSGARPICQIGSAVVGVEAVVGEGHLIIIGDSSVFINEVLRSRYRHPQIVFALAIVDRETVVFYEGGREFVEIPFSPKILVSLPYFVGRFAWYTILGGGPVGAVKTVLFGLVLLAIISPRWLTGLSRYTLSLKYGRRRSQFSVDKLFRESVKAWVEWVDRFGK